MYRCRMSIYDMDFDFDADLDEAAFAEAERAFDAFMSDQISDITDDEQVRYEEWCEMNDLDPTADHWETYYDSSIPEGLG